MEFSSYTTINNRYQLVKKVGRGSFGEVWLAEDTLTKTQVAIKLYIALDDKGLQEFSSEYITTYSLNHPNLLHATYYDIYENMPFLVMPFCPGSSENLIGNTDEKEVWRFIRDTAAGLEYLHSKDIIHRDIKPDNILRNTQGDYLITDFGVSLKMRSTLRRNSKRENGEGDASGTLPYMGPEMFSSQPNSVKATDIWALGATIFEIITGELPYCGQGGVMILHGADTPMVPGEWSQNLKAMIQACLSKETWERPTAGKIRQFADEVLHDKEVFWGDIKEIHMPSVEEKITQSPSATKKSTQYPKQKVKPWLIGIGAIAIAILTLIVVLHYISRPQTEIIVEPLESATEVYSNGLSVRGTVAGHEYVDLGLPSGVLWATCNIGASSPSEYGGYFAWGETSEKKKYDYVSLKYYNNDDKVPYSFSKYNINVSGTKDMKSQLELCDDAANVIWGDKWRIPTEQEWKELKEYCIWSWEKEEGHYGYKVSSPKTGNSIFLPAAGMKDDTYYEHVGQWGRYWSSSLSKDAFSYNAIRCCMSKTEIDPANWHHRCYGHSIRPVISSLNSSERSKDVKDVLKTGLTLDEEQGQHSSKSSKRILGHEYVDLGLPSGVLWATCNIGASNSSDDGEYYAWGETQTKSNYKWSTLKYCIDSGNDDWHDHVKFSKYNINSSYGTVDNKTTLDLEDDAAHANWGGSWRMPTHKEFRELAKYCSWAWTTQSGKNGCKVTSKKNGNSIFFPAAGSFEGIGASQCGTNCYYWSSSVCSLHSNSAKRMSYTYLMSGPFDDEDDYDEEYDGYYRCVGYSVRPVSSPLQN